MHALVSLLLAISILELTIWFRGVWESRKIFSFLTIFLLSPVGVAIFIVRPSALTATILFLSLYRIVNLIRLIKNRIHIEHLYKASSLTSISLIGVQLLLIFLSSISDRFNVNHSIWWLTISFGQLLAGIVVFASTLKHIKTTSPVSLSKAYSDKELPTITVAIPARNETNNLSDCLNSLIRSDYPKLEILVLDDCSQDKRTPDIIRDFALRGVRFISGKIPPDKWLAKNFAYKQLVDESSGELIVFCGVDTRFEPSTIKSLVGLALQKNKNMISLIPSNKLDKELSIWNLLVQPSRYAWELALPRRWFKRPAVLSTCWMIKKSLLVSAGGFEAVANSISPESYFARQSIKANDGYSFMQASGNLLVTSSKSISDQRDTAVRTRYPQLHRRPEMTAFVTLLEFLTLISPVFLVVVGLSIDSYLIVIVSLLSICLQYIAYGKLVDLTYRQSIKFGYIALPVAALYDLFLLNISMLRYEFGEVIWKDRNVCIPIMDVKDGTLKSRNY